MRSLSLLALAALFLSGLRASVWLALGDVFVWGEELDKACVAKAWLDGLPLPWHALVYEPSEGAALVLAALEAAGFAWLGPCLLVLKLAALVLELALLAVGFAACRATGGLRAAALFGLLLALGPRSSQQGAALAVGLHYDAGLAAVAILWSAVRVVERPERARWIAFGLCSGLGIAYAWTALVAVVAGGALIAWRRPRWLARREALAGLAGLLAGLAPLAVLAVHHGAQVLPDHGAEPLSRVPWLELARSLLVDREPLDLLGLALRVLAACSVLVVRGPWRTALLLHAACFWLAYATSGFALGALPYAYPLQRFAPLVLDATLASALGLAALLSDPRRPVRAAAALCLVALAALGARDALLLRSRGSARTDPARGLEALLATKGYAYERYLQRVAARLDGPLDEHAARVAAFDEDAPERLHEALGRAWIAPEDSEPARLRALLERLPPKLRPGVARGAGAAWMLRHGRDLERAARAANALEEPLRSWLLEGCGRAAILRHPTAEALRERVARVTRAGLPDLVLTGLGAQLVHVRAERMPEAWHEPLATPWRLADEGARRFLERSDPRAAEALRRGWLAALERERLRARR